MGRLGFSPVFQRSIDASPDLQRLLAIVPEVEGGRSITVVQNWPQLIGAR